MTNRRYAVAGVAALAMLTLGLTVVGEVKADEIVINYTDYGAATAPQKPAASETIEAPASAYDFL